MCVCVCVCARARAPMIVWCDVSRTTDRRWDGKSPGGKGGLIKGDHEKTYPGHLLIFVHNGKAALAKVHLYKTEVERYSSVKKKE